MMVVSPIVFYSYQGAAGSPKKKRSDEPSPPEKVCYALCMCDDDDPSVVVSPSKSSLSFIYYRLLPASFIQFISCPE